MLNLNKILPSPVHKSKFFSFAVSRASLITLSLIFLFGCDTNSDYTFGAEDEIIGTFSTPSRIKPKALSTDCAGSLSAVLRIDGKTTQLTNSGNAWSGTVEDVDTGSQTATIEFSCEFEGNSLVLASASSTLSVEKDANTNLSFDDESYSMAHDDDSDGGNNLQEIELGSDPFSSDKVIATSENGSYATATPITFGKIVRAQIPALAQDKYSIGQNSPDYYKVTVTEEDDYQIYLNGSGVEGKDDLLIYLIEQRNSDPNNFASNNNGVKSLSRYTSGIEQIEYQLFVKTYYLVVENYSNSEETYSLQINKVATIGAFENPLNRPQRVPARFPGETVNGEKRSGVANPRPSLVGCVNSNSDDIDVYRYKPIGTRKYQLDLEYGFEGVTSGNSDLDIRVHRDSDYTSVVAINDDEETGDGERTASLVVTLEDGGDYQIVVEGFETNGVKECFDLNFLDAPEDSG